jgi:hypothetical protein
MIPLTVQKLASNFWQHLLDIPGDGLEMHEVTESTSSALTDRKRTIV